MLAKPTTAVAVPAIVFAIDTLFAGRTPREALRAVAPLSLLAIPILVVGKLAQPSSLIAPIPLWWRPFVAGDSLAFYLLKLIAPIELGIDYGRTPQHVIESRIAFVTSAATIAVLLVTIRFARRRWLTGPAVFLAALLPVLGFVTFEFQKRSTVADHYLYLPMLGAAVLGAMVLDRYRSRVLSITAVVALTALGGRAWFATWAWRDSATLFAHALAVNPRSAAAVNNLLLLDIDAGRAADALVRADQLRLLAPDEPETHFNYGHVLAMNGRYEQAAQTYRAAIDRWPTRVEGYTGLAAALVDLGRIDDALAQYDAAIRVAPDNADVRALRARVASRRPATTLPDRSRDPSHE
jgi:hypothetical protein